MNEVLAIIVSVLYLTVIFYIFRDVAQKTVNWLFFLLFEYFFIFGLGISHLFYVFYGGIVYDNAIYRYDELSSLTFVHVFMYALGSIVGYKVLFKQDRVIEGVALFVKNYIVFRAESIFFFIVFLSISSSVIYISILGIELTVLSASAARSGNFDLIENYTQYRFLNRFSVIGLFSIVFIPYFLQKKVLIKTTFFLVFISSILVYLISVSRFALVIGIFLPALLYWSYYGKKSFNYNLFMIVMFFLALLVLFFGKSFVAYLANLIFLDNNDALMVGESKKISDTLHAFLQNFSHLILSINAGILFFFSSGLVFFRDIVLAPFSIIPSAFMAGIGLEDLSYQFLDTTQRFSCVNTINIIPGSDGCFIPAYFTGASAYTLPIVGGFLFGFIKFHIYRVSVELLKRNQDPHFVVSVLLMLFFLDQLYLFIPNTISLVVFTVLLLISITFLFRLLRKGKL
jgi:hypothetical protein